MAPGECRAQNARIYSAAALVLTCAWAGASALSTDYSLLSLTTTPALDRYEISPFESGNDEQDLLTWAAAARQENAQTHSPPFITVPPSTQLLIGVKSAVIHGFPSRQLIRQTWADPSRLPLDAHVVFLGCEPNVTSYDTARQTQWRDAVQLEKLTYRDVLTDELACHDSYFSLVDKVKGFFRWTTSQVAPHLVFVMIADDDVFIRVDALFNALVTQPSQKISRHRFYAGQVIATQFELLIPMDRHPLDKNAVPLHQYQMTYKPPFASGAHYLLSMDLVEFLARNHNSLVGVGTLEDVSVAYWLLALLQLQPMHIREFDNVRYKLCHKSLIGYADLTRATMRRMDHNVRHNKSLCDGFSFQQSDKRTFQSELPNMELRSAARVSRPLRQHWQLQYNTTARTLQIHLSLSAMGTNENQTIESMTMVFTPTTHNFAHFCHQLHLQLQLPETSMPTTGIPQDACYALRSLLTPLVDAASQDAPAASHVLALAKRNLRHGANSAAVIVQLLHNAIHWRVLVECLLVASFPDAHVAVLSEHELAHGEPDIVVAALGDLLESDLVRQLPALSRLVVIASAAHSSVAIQSLKRSGVVYISPDALLCPKQRSHNDQHHHQHHQLHVPLASLSFVDRKSHSPRQLLQSIYTTEGDNDSDSARRETVVGLCGCTSARDSSAEAHVLLQELLAMNIPTPPPCEAPPVAAFHLDTHVRRCQQIQFAVVVEDSHLVDTPGHISDRIVSAFLAGSIPIYYGHSATVAWLFNRNAFIDCRAFGSISKCAAHVARIHSSVDLYEAMRREPPVVNHTAFREVFSWHPDAGPSEDCGENSTLGERFKELLLRS